MNISKSFQKIKSTLDLKTDEKLVIGKLANSTPSNPGLGYVDVYFLVNEGIVTVANPHDFMVSEYPTKAQVFIRGGYESFEKEFGYDKFFLFKTSVNTQPSDKGACIYASVYSSAGQQQNLKLTREYPFVAEISCTNFDAITINSIESAHIIKEIENDYQDSPCLFQIDVTSKKILGPLIASDNDKTIFHGPKNKITYEFWNSRSLSDHQTFLSSYRGYEEHIKTIKINGTTRRFLINLDSFYIGLNNKPRNQDFTLVDLIPENCLINEFYKATNKVDSIKPFQKGKVKEWLGNKALKLDKIRIARLSKLLNAYELENATIAKIFKNILESELAEPLLKQFANEDEDKYLERYRNKENAKIELIKTEIQRKKSEIEQQNDAVKKELSKIQEELRGFNKEKKELQLEIDEELKVALADIEKSEKYQSMLNESNQALYNVNKKVEDATKVYGNYENLEALRHKTEEYKGDIMYLERNKKEFEDIINGLKKDARKSISELAQEYLKQQVISDIQNHDHYKYLVDQPTNTKNEIKSYITEAESSIEFTTDNHNSNRKAVVAEVTKRLHNMNRVITQEKVEAALIAIMQNQFVVLIGVPGSGKTSFAIQFGCALGASKSTLTVPVAKDWTRPKDLMGYYNPISNVYESGVTNFYPFYSSLNKSSEDITTNSFLILDEFNLSQPEFYMSNLTGLADNSISRTINLGNNTNIDIPETNRFICTANTDETVQSLSARMISRCAFIQFNELPDLDQTVMDLEFRTSLPPILTGSDMVSLFTATDSDIISSIQKEEIDKLISAFREDSDKYGNGLSITPRKYNQLLQFCRVMSVQEHGQSTVLDYATTFFLIPLIAGSGKLFKERLKNIKSIGEDLSLEEFVKNIDSIINEGEANFEHYRFIMG